MRFPVCACSVLTVGILSATSAPAAFDAATYYVDAVHGDDANDGATPERAKATIQAMYDAAKTDATIWVAPGAYSNDVGRGVNSTHWWGRSRLNLGAKSMRIVSMGGAAVTHIVGKLGPTGGYGSTGTTDYDSATRCIDVEMDESREIVVEGFTLRDGATLDVNANPRGSGGAVFCWNGGDLYPRTFALVDCVISNCYGAYSLVTGGSLVRCRIEDNTFYKNSAGKLPFSFNQCNVLNSRVFNNRAVDRETRRKAEAGNICTFNSRFVNATFANNRYAHYSNEPTWYYSCLFAVSAFRTDDGSTEVKGGCQSNVVVDTVSTRCALAPTAGDIRIRRGSLAETAGRVAALADASLFPLPSGVDRFRDIDGNVIASDAETICAGASQAVVTPASGAICGANEYVSFDGVGRPHRTAAWIYPEAWPTSVQLRAVAQDGQSFRRFWLSDCGYRDVVGAYTNRVRASRLPVRGSDGGWNTAWFIPPRATDAALTVTAVCEPSANVRHCDPNAADDATADGTPEKPFRTIQAAIDSLGDTGLVLLRPGVYAEGNGSVNSQMKARVSFGRKNITVRGLGGAEQTVIRGAADPDTGTYGPNATLVAALNSSAQIQGVTLTGGHSGGSDSWEGSDGRGAIYSYGQDLELVDCIITNNVGKNYALGTAWFERCLIRGNTGGLGLAVEPVFVSCVIGDNTVTKSSRPFLGLWNAYVTKLFSTTFVGDGARTIWPSGGSLAACAVNSVIVRGKGPTAFAKGGVTGCVLSGFDPSGTGFVAADPMLRDADALDVRLFTQSPALSAATIPADGELGESWWYACPMDFHGNPWRFDAAGRPVAGAVQETFAGGVYVATGEGYEVVSGGAFGFNELKDGETLTIGFAPGSTRPLAGFVVNGVTNLFSESTVGLPTLTVPGGAAGVVEPIYSSTWYVDAVNGSDTEKFGYNPATAYRTLAAALANANLVAGQAVMALPGTYREGSMIQNAAKSVRARGVVPIGVTLASRDGAAATVIEGAPATVRDQAKNTAFQSTIDTGMGKDAIRGVYLQANAAVEGFTFTNCFTRGASDAGTGLHGDDDGCGAGVRAASLSCVVRDCVFVGNTAFRGGGVYNATAVNCVFDGNAALYGGGAASDANLYGCLTKNNVCAGNGRWGGLFYYGTVDSCTVLDSLGGANSLRSCSTVNTLVLGCLGDWDWAVGPTNYAHCCFANDVGGFVQDSAAHRTAIESGDGNILAPLAELPVDDAGRPFIGNAAVDRADAALSAHVGDRDLLGGQRVYNGTRDIGALEADWRTAYARDVNRRLMISAVSPAVVETAERHVRLVDGTSLVATLRNAGAVDKVRIRASVSGGGTLTVRVNGEAVQTLSDGEHETPVALASPETDELSFAYAGDGFADLGRLSLDRGFLFIVR